jgi:hypothetical protein
MMPNIAMASIVAMGLRMNVSEKFTPASGLLSAT